MLLIFSRKNSPRLSYIFDLIIRDILGVNYKLTSNEEEFVNSPDPKFCYGDQPLGDELFVSAAKLLFEKGIIDQELTVFRFENTIAFYGTHPKYTIPFDLFAASFFMVSRYEEYLPHIRDRHDRFSAHESIAYQKGFLKQPVVEIWANYFRRILLEKFPDLEYRKRKYKMISTIDIDNAYAYKEKGFMRIAGGYVRDLSLLDFSQITERTKVLLGLLKDPYDTYDYQLEIQQKYDLEVIYFFLLAEYGENDKNVPARSKKLQSLIKNLSDYARIGIHPSYASNTNPEYITSEISKLQKILKREVKLSRQHFLKLSFPETYNRLIDHDITDDYTMGYAAEIGFRAGTSSPFYFYDLDLEQATPLRLHPFAVMEASLKYYMKVEPAQALEQIIPMIDEVKKVDGTFVSLWHNESLSNHKQWTGWKEVYEKMIAYAMRNDTLS